MVKTAFKTLFKNWKLCFMIGGLVYFALILFAYLLIKGLVLILGDNLNLMISQIFEVVSNYVAALSLQEILQLPTIFEKIADIIKTHTAQSGTEIVALITSLTVLLVVAFELSKSMSLAGIRKESRGKFASFLAITLRTVFSVLVIFLSVFVMTKWFYGVIFTVLLWLVGFPLLNLAAYKMTEFKKVPLLKRAGGKLIAASILLGPLSYLVAVALFILLALIFGAAVAIILLLPLMVYVTACFESASYLFMKEKINGNTEVKAHDCQT